MVGAVRRDYQSPVVCDRSSLFDQFRRSFRLRPDDFGRFDSQKGSFDLVSQGCEGREESNELLVPSSSVNIKIDSPKSVLRPRRTRDLTLNLSWHAWIARKEALEAYFDEIVRVVKKFRNEIKPDQMPTINWNVDKTTEEEEGLGSHHLLKQIAGMFAVAHRMIEDLSISKNFNLNPRGSSEMETFLYNFRQGLLARLGRCGDGLREIQSQHNSILASRSASHSRSTSLIPRKESLHGETSKTIGEVAPKGIVSIVCPSNTFSEVPSFNFGQGTNFNPINDGYSQPGGSRQENSSLLYEQHQALIFADPLEKSAQMECSLIFREREREIEKVSDGVLQVVELLQSMHTTVVEQGTLLDRIDYNLDEASHLVSQAVVHIGRRNDRQKKFTFRHLTLLVIVLLILSVIIAIAIKLKM